jgi:twitching motility two-component system response regulator PilH
MSQTLLVADDSLAIQRVIQLALANEDLGVVVATSGEQAIQEIEVNPPDLVLADTRMPNHSGYEIAEVLNSRSSHQSIPVVLMAGAFETLDKHRAKAAGCMAVFVKPFEPGELVTTVRELLAFSLRSTDHVSMNVEPLAAESDLTWLVNDELNGALVELERVTVPAQAMVSTVLTDHAPPALIVTDELVARSATCVIANLSDRVVRETTTDFVSRIAERLVREEIKRLKDKLRQVIWLS